MMQPKRAAGCRSRAWHSGVHFQLDGLVSALKDLKFCYNIIVTPFSDHVSCVFPQYLGITCVGEIGRRETTMGQNLLRSLLRNSVWVCKIWNKRKGYGRYTSWGCSMHKGKGTECTCSVQGIGRPGTGVTHLDGGSQSSPGHHSRE